MTIHTHSTKCTKDYAHCEQCGSRVEPFQCADGYTPCCNELISYGNIGCRNFHGEEELFQAILDEAVAASPYATRTEWVDADRDGWQAVIDGAERKVYGR